MLAWFVVNAIAIDKCISLKYSVADTQQQKSWDGDSKHLYKVTMLTRQM